jgi:homoserine kinase
MPTEPTPAEKGEIVLRVPGSIANLGPGFDTLAVAVQLYLTLRVRRAKGNTGLRFEFVNQKLDGENYIERAFRFIAERHEQPIPSLDIQVESDIPMKGGLGSSAAATVAGLRLFQLIVGPTMVGHNVVPVTERELLLAACELEGHPDNIAAALLGGLTVSCEMDGGLRVLRAAWPESLAIIVATPEQHLATKASRAVLPALISREDAIFNVQRVAFLLEALRTADFTLLRQALEDRLHQPYRAAIVPGLKEALALRHPSLLGCCLSGAGPSIAAFAQKDLDQIAALLTDIFTRMSIPVHVQTLLVHPTNAPLTAQPSLTVRPTVPEPAGGCKP